MTSAGLSPINRRMVPPPAQRVQRVRSGDDLGPLRQAPGPLDVGVGEEAGVQFQVTVGLGQHSVNGTVPDDRATALQDGVDAMGQGVGVVVVDLVEAALQLVLAVRGGDAAGP